MKAFASALVPLFVVLGAHAAKVPYPSSEIRESTDPAKVAEVERHAQQLGAPASSMLGSGTSAQTDTATAEPKKHRAKKHHGARKAAKSSDSAK